MEHLHSIIISQDDTEVVVEVEVANVFGPSTNLDGYPAATLKRLAYAATADLDVMDRLPLFFELNEEDYIGEVTRCFLFDEGRRLMCRARIDLTTAASKRKDFSPTLPLAFSVFVRYTLCSGCGKPLLNVSENPCREQDFHVIPPEAIDTESLFFGMVLNNAFDRPLGDEVQMPVEEGEEQVVSETSSDTEPDIEWEAFRQLDE